MQAPILLDLAEIGDDRLDAAEGGVAGLPDHRAGGVGRHHRPVDVIDMEEVERAALDQRERTVAEPDILAHESAGAAIMLGDTLAGAPRGASTPLNESVRACRRPTLAVAEL